MYVTDTKIILLRIGAVEYALVLYRNKLPKFRNNGHAIKNWFEFKRDGKDIPRLHPTQKTINLLKRLIEIFTDDGDVIIDPCTGAGATLRAAKELNIDAYGFEISANPYILLRTQSLKPAVELVHVSN